MHSLLPLVFLPFLSFSAMAAPTTFTSKPLDGNQTIVRTEQRYLDMSMDLHVDGQKVGTFTAKNTVMKQVTLVLEKWTKKKRVALFQFGEHDDKDIQTLPDGTSEVKEKPFVLEGQNISVLWTSKSDAPVFTKEDGTPLSSEEEAAMTTEWNEVKNMKQGAFEKAIAGVPLEVNKEVPIDEDTLIEMLGIKDDDLNVSEPKLAFTEIRDHAGESCGVFTVNVVFQPKENQLNINMAMEGTVLVSIDGMDIHALTMEGPMTVSASGVQNGQTMEMTGGGTASFKNTLDYQR